MTCPVCQITLPPGNLFCSACGNKGIMMSGGISREELRAELKAVRAELRLLIVSVFIASSFVNQFGLSSIAGAVAAIGVMTLGFITKIFLIKS